MYKYLLCWRYVRTRWIALASIISVTLGVATLIVVNSVMAGFSTEMRDRLHAILADIKIDSRTMNGFPDPEEKIALIRENLGDKIAAMTPTVEIVGMVSYQFMGEWITTPVQVIGIDPEGRARVGRFAEHLMDPEKRDYPSFDLGAKATEHRRKVYAARQNLSSEAPALSPETIQDTNPFSEASATPLQESSPVTGRVQANAPTFLSDFNSDSGKSAPIEPDALQSSDPFDSFGQEDSSADSWDLADDTSSYDPAAPQTMRIILGHLLVNYRHQDAKGNAREISMVRPGDDVKLTLPTAGQPPKPVYDNATVVDYFKSNMSEYDAHFAFVPLKELQYLRGMVDPETGTRYATSIQIKLHDYADAPMVVSELKKIFPSSQFAVHTWEQQQGPLLAAVDIESSILNVLLFLIIAVAGFGILAIFYMIVVEKTRDIGILKAIGASSRGIMGIFLSYGLSLGMIGSGLGMTMGLLFVHYINEIEWLVSQITGHKVFDERIYYFSTIPTLVNPFTIAWIVGGALLIAVASSILPARRAARLHPVEALRYDQ